MFQLTHSLAVAKPLHGAQSLFSTIIIIAMPAGLSIVSEFNSFASSIKTIAKLSIEHLPSLSQGNAAVTATKPQSKHNAGLSTVSESPAIIGSSFVSDACLANVLPSSVVETGASSGPERFDCEAYQQTVAEIETKLRPFSHFKEYNPNSLFYHVSTVKKEAWGATAIAHERYGKVHLKLMNMSSNEFLHQDGVAEPKRNLFKRMFAKKSKMSKYTNCDGKKCYFQVEDGALMEFEHKGILVTISNIREFEVKKTKRNWKSFSFKKYVPALKQ